MEQRLDDGEWGGYAGGDAPGLAFETANGFMITKLPPYVLIHGVVK